MACIGCRRRRRGNRRWRRSDAREWPPQSRMRENRPSGLMSGGARRSLALCLFNPSAPPTLRNPNSKVERRNIGRDWGAYASGVWFSASRRKLRLSRFPAPGNPGKWWDESPGATPELACRRRALPFLTRRSGSRENCFCGASTGGDLTAPSAGGKWPFSRSGEPA